MISQAAINAMATEYVRTISELSLRLGNAGGEVAILNERCAALQNENAELKKKLAEVAQSPSTPEL